MSVADGSGRGVSRSGGTVGVAIGLVVSLIVGVLVAAPVSADEPAQADLPADEALPVAESRAVGEPSSVVSLVPARVLETRAGRPTADGLFEGIGRRSARQVTEVDVLDRVGVPADGVEAVVMNATAIGALQRGFLTVFPCGERPEASSVNYEAGGPAVANEVIAKVSDAGTVCVFNQRDLDIALDVVGYIGAADTETRATGEPSSVVSLVPARVLETRAGRPTADGLFEGIGRRSARQVTEVDVVDRVGVPADGVEAVVMNATAIGALQRGFLTVFPCGDRPEASSVNYEAGGPAVANEVIAKVSDAGTVCVFNQRELDIVLDVVGYISSIPTPTDPPPVDPPPVDPPPPPPPGDIEVPDVVGLQQGQAIERIVDETLVPALGGSRHDDAPAGEVIEQTPTAGTGVESGTDVDFVLSLGPELVTVPDVLGDDEATARSKIEAAGLTVGDVGSGESDDFAVDEVNLQLPLAGQEVLPGTPVDITITSGLVNDPPEITTNPVTEHTVGGEYVYDVDATDPESDPITFVLQAGPLDEQGDPLAAIDPTTGVLTWTPSTDDAGPVDFAVRAEDGNGGIDVQSFTLEVSVPNRPPTPEDDVYGVAINDVLTVDPDTGVLSNDTDPDDDDLTAAIVDEPANGQVEVAADGSFVYTPFQQGSGGTRFSDIDLTRFSLEDVVTSTASPSFGSERLVDRYVGTAWVADGTEGQTGQITLSFDAPVSPTTLELLGVRGFNADSVLGVREVDVTLLDGDGATVLSLPAQVFPPNVPGDQQDADLEIDLEAAAGGTAPEGVRTVVIDIVDTDGGAPGLAEVILTGEGPRRNLSPDIQWSWTDDNGVFGAAMQSPTVGDLDNDGFPEVLFLSATPTFLSSSVSFLYAMDGRDGSLKWVTEQIVRSSSAPVLGDLNNDGFLEVVTVGSSAGVIVVFDHEGNEIGRSSSLGVLSNLALADLDGDGAAEIVSGSNNQVVALSVTFDEFGDVTIGERWRTPVAKGCGAQGGTTFCVPVVADVDLDGQPEILAGNRVVGFDGSIEHDSTLTDGFVAVGNFDDDPEAEIVQISGGNVRLLNHDLSEVWGPVTIPGGGRGGPPTIGDYDSDGEPEIGVAASARYFVLDTDGTELWQATTVDGSSNVTGSTIFDFDDDGTTEVVYRDEQDLWIFDGPTGEVRSQIPIRSFTLIEYPVVADVDADGQAEIVVTSDADKTLPDGTTREKGLYVFEGGLGDWVRARSIWNQHSYHVTNVNNDGTIPVVEPTNWLDGSLNNFREQSFPSDDFTGLDSFTYEVSDPSGATSEATAFVEVRSPQNDPVVTCTPPATATVGFDYVGRVCADDPDGDDLTFDGVATQAATANIAPRAHPWLAGQPDGATLFGDGAPDDSPILVATDDFFAAGDALTFNVSGNAGTDVATVGPEGAGDAFFATQNGLAGLRSQFASLVGVFVSDDVPSGGSPPPADLDFRSSALGVDFANLSPELRQPFFIGDGLTTDGDVQEFIVPVGATRLFLGVMDDDAWATNPGTGFDVTVIS
ncbi:MAG: FG-GAP-like repeat-containing protein, partial [Actinomycetota bacterium]